jgi:hypothetical protein
LKGTFLELVIETLESGKFIDEDDKLKKGEVVIRDMTDLEKAIWTEKSKTFDLCKSKSEELEELMKSDVFIPVGLSISIGSGGMDAGMAFGVTDDKHVDVIKARQLQDEINQLEKSSKPLNTFFWKLVKSDIPQEQKDTYDITSIRQGFKIVMFNED